MLLSIKKIKSWYLAVLNCIFIHLGLGIFYKDQVAILVHYFMQMDIIVEII
jgi:hypothetical protein